MPMPIANNAVCGYIDDPFLKIYSFSGIDSSLDHEGISLASFKFDGEGLTGSWSSLPDLPDTLGKIAAGCSYLDGKIYIIGGYHVFPGGNELSSDRVHIFDTNTDSFEPDGAPIPVAIDDHIQAIWRDSLIFVVTGWSNTTNVANVQIYDPANDNWQVGTPVPNTSNYKVFGGSGVIVGDTLYYIGGARFGFNFPLGMVFRKGAIDPTDPTNITWSDQMVPEALGYRMAASYILGSGGDFKVVWIGGSTISYNYDAIAYNGSGLVEPEERVVVYENGNLSIETDLPPIMDLRGAVNSDSPGTAIFTAGGIGPGGVVSDKFYVYLQGPTGLPSFEEAGIEIYPSISTGNFQLDIPFGFSSASLQVYSTSGESVFSEIVSAGRFSLELSNFAPGIYLLSLRQNDRTFQSKITIAK